MNIRRAEQSSVSDSEFENLQEELLANAFYIYVVLVFVAIVFGVILFGIREYFLASRMKQMPVEIQENITESPERDSPIESEKEQEQIDSPDEIPDRTLDKVSHRPNDSVSSPDLSLRKEIESSLAAIDFQPVDSPGSSENFEKLVVITADSLGTDPDFDKTVSAPPKKTTYRFTQLMEIFESMQKALPKQRHQPVYSICVPKMSFTSVWQADRHISDLRKNLISDPKDTMSVLQVICIGASYDCFDNENYFLTSFSDFIESLVDEGVVFDMMDFSQPNVTALLSELIQVYSWNHWNFHESTNRQRNHISTIFRMWNYNTPLVQPHTVIFRIMCNASLGLGNVKTTKVNVQITKKQRKNHHELFKELIKTSYCSEYVGFMPMLAQSVALCTTDFTKYQFYDLLGKLLHTHSDCCMSEYIFDPGNTHLKALIQHGLWKNHGKMVAEKVKEVYEFLLRKNAKIKQWHHEVKGGDKYVIASGVVTASLQPPSNRPSTPGAWRFSG